MIEQNSNSVALKQTVQSDLNYRLPSDATLKHAAKLSIVEDKPIMLDYWTTSLDKKALIGVRDSGEKLLVKSEDEYTSPVAKFYKSGQEYISLQKTLFISFLVRFLHEKYLKFIFIFYKYKLYYILYK